MRKDIRGRTLGMVFYGVNKETGDEEILDVLMLAPWERELDEEEANEILGNRICGYWNSNEKFFERRGYEDFGVRSLEVV